MDLSTAIEKILDGRSVLFLGSGFSQGAINIQGSRLPSGPELTTRFARLSDLPEDISLEDAAEAYDNRFGVDELIKVIRRDFTVREVKDFHRRIATLPWSHIYTTNYDNVIERACHFEGKGIVPVTFDTDPRKMSKEDTLCIHMNGYVEQLDRDKIHRELKLTETSYLTSSIAESPWVMLFRQHLRFAQSVFFLGYSLHDLDIKRILIESPDLREKTFFVLGENPDAATIQRASRYGTVLKMTVEQFSHNIEDVKTTYISGEPVFSPLSVKEHTLMTAIDVNITDRDFLDLLLFGQRDEKLIAKSFETGIKYYLERIYTEEVFKFIDRGHRCLVICSDLGNGKSLFLEGLRIRALEKGFRVFSVTEPSDSTSAEMAEIAQLQQKTLTTVEEYQNWLNEIRLFRMNASPKAVLILTARNVIHDVVFDDLMDVVAVRDIPEISLDILRETEITWFAETLDTYGLWGDRAGLTKNKKEQFIRETCQSQIHAVLLKLFSSPHISRKIQTITDDLKTDGSNYRVLLSILILSILNFHVDHHVLSDIWGVDRVGSTKFRRSPAVRHFIDYSTSELRVKSSVVAEYILRHSADASTLVDVLITMTKQAHKGSGARYLYDILFKNLVRFGSLQLILPEENRRNAVIGYYEAVKNLPRCKENPLFWLQYAIASLVANDLYRSKLYFDTAYSLAGADFKTYQIDNHYARFLLVQAVTELECPQALENFRLARAIINRQILDERRHYPYKVATAYQSFLDKFGTSLNVGEVAEVVSAANEILERIRSLPEGRRRHRYNVECGKAMRYVVDRGTELLKQKAEGSIGHE